MISLSLEPNMDQTNLIKLVVAAPVTSIRLKSFILWEQIEQPLTDQVDYNVIPL